MNDQIVESCFTALDFIQNELRERGSKFLDGEQPGYADYMMWPWFERLIALEDERINMDEQKYGLIVSYLPFV